MLNWTKRAAILRFDTCKIANAIEKLNIRLRNEGFTRPGLRCLTPGSPAVLGYAVTSKVKCADPPLDGYSYYDLSDWWEIVRSSPHPAVAVIQDADLNPGQGAVLSDVHAEVLHALECGGLVTNGAVRDVPTVARSGFAVFACQVTMSHAYVHMVDFDAPVEVMGLKVRPGELIYADVHGLLAIPEERVDEILHIAECQAARERTIIDLCRSSQFSFESLRAAVKSL
jgi:regulator of RNase E activity RraA